MYTKTTNPEKERTLILPKLEWSQLLPLLLFAVALLATWAHCTNGVVCAVQDTSIY